MYVVNNSARALLLALIPLAAAHAVLTAMALLGAGVAQPADIPPPDQVLVFYVTRLTLDGALLFAGHWMLRQRGVSSRYSYALMGGAMATAGFGIALRYNLQLLSPGDGSLLAMGLLPAIAGMIAGFLYVRFAGLAPATRFQIFTASLDSPEIAMKGLAAIGAAIFIVLAGVLWFMTRPALVMTAAEPLQASPTFKPVR